VAQKNQLWILLGFFGMIGLFAGLAIWQINQSQQRDRELSKVKTELEQTTQQLKILKAQNATSISDKGKLIKDVTMSKKLLTDFQQKGLKLEQQLKAAQDMLTKVADENSKLKLQQINQGNTSQPSAAGKSSGSTQPKAEPTGPARAELLLPR
jgi:uncharacterized membrane-anchored protein YhcB (DUF1043 family)